MIVAAGRKPPRYRQTEVLDRACAYVRAHLDLWAGAEDPPQFPQIWSHRFDALTSLIFESNAFEGAGLAEAETRAALEELGISRGSSLPPGRIVEIAQVRDLFASPFADVDSEQVILQFRGRSRGSREVTAMAKLEVDARRVFAESTLAVEPTIYELVARFSHRIVAIHPFPDFNGRLSRLALSVIMQRAAVPFSVSIKFDKKGRERYLYALRRGDKGDLRPMTMLVARAVVDGFETIDARLELAGLPRLLPPADA